MPTYNPHTKEDVKGMLEKIGVRDIEDLFSPIPKSIRLERPLDIDGADGEMETVSRMKTLANQNHVFKTVFRGAGAYRHFIPSVVQEIASREEFLTAYTPYQAEISQGVLQSIFEYQTMMCELTGMDVSNASIYDGAVAAAESACMCIDKKRAKILISSTVNPQTLTVMRTYLGSHGGEIVMLKEKDGVTDIKDLESAIDSETACVYIESPNFYGQIENAEKIGEITHEAGAKYVMGVNPISLAILKTPAECGADVAVGEGQPLGMPLSFGGPYLGFITAKESMTRKLPGRIVGETVDKDGKRAYVLTLQAREQHIRREKASSSLCSNQALCALTASIYLSAMGPEGMNEVAKLCAAKAHYLAKCLCDIDGISLKYKGEYFHEFVTESAVSSDKILEALQKEDILGGLKLDEHSILWCATEVNSKEEIERAAEIIKGVSK